MSAQAASSCQERVVALLKLARCSVTIEPDGRHNLLRARYQTPLGERSTLGVCLGAGLLQEERDALTGVLEGSGAQAEERVAFYESSAEKPPQSVEGLRFIAVDELARQVILSTGFSYVCDRELQELIDSTKLIPVPAHVSASVGEVDDHTSDARLALLEFARDRREDICCVLGSFGSGKSVLLHSFAHLATLAGADIDVFPLVVDLAGWGGTGLATALDRRISELFGTFAPGGIEDLRAAFGDSVELVLLLDSIDEQTDLNAGAIGSLIDKILALARHGQRMIIAFRPEIFEGSIDQKGMLFDRIAQKGLRYRIVEMLPIDEEYVEIALGPLLLSNGAREIALDLGRRPVWLEAVRGLREVGSAEGQIIDVIEHCILEWAQREEGTKRPALLSRSQRDSLTILLALCLHSGYGIHVERPGQVHRSELVRFVRSLIPKLQQIEPEAYHYLRWLELPADLTAESLAVANLLVIDHEGFLSFADSIFFQYYVARGVVTALRGGRDSILGETAVLDIFGIQTPAELLGIAPLPDQAFGEIIHAYLARHTTSGWRIEDRVESLLDDLRRRPKGVPPWQELVVDFRPGQLEELRTYEIATPTQWPRFASWFSGFNGLMLLANKGREIVGQDFSFTDLSGCDLSGIRFERCRFVGADLSYALLGGTRLSNCDVNYALVRYDAQEELADLLSQDGGDEIIVWGSETPESLRARSAAMLGKLARETGEVLVCGDEPIACPENLGYPLLISPFFVDAAPVTNGQFDAFLEANATYGAADHGRDIENQYYLAALTAENGGSQLPVVYVTLLAAVAYAISVGKRLPNIAEVVAYSRVLGCAPDPEMTPNRYEDLPRVVEGDIYPPGYVTEWTYQIDDQDYWSRLPARAPVGFRRVVCPLPPYRRGEGLRCEYLVAGRSYLPKRVIGKSSKPATWINPDQGFRCVLDYRAAVRRHFAGP